MEYYINILLPVATDGVYTYTADCPVPAGVRVKVPLGKRVVMGISLGETEQPSFKCRPIIGAVDEKPLFSAVWLAFIKKISEYYSTTLGATLHGVLSTKLLDSTSAEEGAPPTFSPINIDLTPEQQVIVEKIPLKGYSAHLIQGVTGSGKTEVYLEFAKRVINDGRQVLYLVPEIALTTQFVERIKARLGVEPAIFHSKLTEKKRKAAFWGFLQGGNSVLIGPRSALFVPSVNIGLIIIDEEHETGYKQESTPPYHLRDMAILYASMLDIPVILGSATPQTESVFNAQIKKYNIHYLLNRSGTAALPRLDIIDMKKHDLVGGIMAEPMYDRLCTTINAGQQAIIFLNRKGYSTSLFCSSCGALQECLNCSVALTMYRGGHSTCHYCGTNYEELVCRDCGGGNMHDSGVGTEKVEEFIEQMFPQKSARLDGDNISSFKQLNKTLTDFYDKKIQILIGTQLIAKGLHFPGVTFVGIMGIDNVIAMPEFRSLEKAYQLLMQVSGRAGRGDEKGIVHIQTYLPEHPIFEFISTEPTKLDPGGLAQDFYKYELARRREFSYPPYVKLARLIISHSDERDLQIFAKKLVDLLAGKYKKAKFMGPSAAVIYKIKNRYRMSVLVKSGSHKELGNILHDANKLFENHKKGAMEMKIDRDPYFFM